MEKYSYTRTSFSSFICSLDCNCINYGFRENGLIVLSPTLIFGKMAFLDNLLWQNDAVDLHEIVRVCLSCGGLLLFKFS